MVKAFVFGKFLPFHKGHEAMIRFALTKSDFLTVLICCSDKENITAATRKNWIEKSFTGVSNIAIDCLNYSEAELPNTSVPSKTVSAIWAEKFKTIFPGYELVITSEAYGNYVARFMGITHIPFDIPRQLFPVSATAVRNDLFACWQFLPDSVKTDLAIKIVILGTESTGKTTLSENLARYFNCSLVSEAGRDLVADSKAFAFEDLHAIAAAHAARISAAVTGPSPLVMIDTDIHITCSYAGFVFGKTLEVSNDIYNINKADIYLYLCNDVAYVQDGTRLNERERNLLDVSHRQVLQQHGINITEIAGNWEQRFEKAVNIIKQHIKQRSTQTGN